MTNLVNKNKTHCLHGHPFDTENTRYNARGHRACKTCRNQQRQARYKRTYPRQGPRGHNLKGQNNAHKYGFIGEQHPEWKGDAAQANTKRNRAQRRYPLGPCEDCGKQGIDRHHKDEDTGNNVPENIAILCRRCHMQRDGRLARLGHQIHLDRQPPQPCRICGRNYKPLRKGRCGACDMYWRRAGKEWNTSVLKSKPRQEGPVDRLHKTQ